MPRYYFNLSDGFAEDDDAGVVFAEVAQARLSAVKYAGELLRDHPELLSTEHDFQIVVTDEQNEPVYRITVSAAVAMPVAD